MAKLSQLKQNKIRCLFVCNEYGEVTKVSDQSKLDNALPVYENNVVVKVFNPSQQQKMDILSLLEKHTGEDSISLSGELLLEVIKELTDIEIDLDDKEEIASILDEPNDLLVSVNAEINSILLGLITMQYRNINDMAKLPPELLKAAVEGVAIEKESKAPSKKKPTSKK